MDRNEFTQKMEDPNTRILSLEEQGKLIDDSIAKCMDRYSRFVGYNNCEIVREELSELDIEISKAMRDKMDRMGLIEEMADVVAGLQYLMKIFNISQEELEKGISIKLNRESSRTDHFGQ